MNNTELFKKLKNLIHVDLEECTDTSSNKLVQPYKLGYHNAQRKLYSELLQIVQWSDQERLDSRKIEQAIEFLNTLEGYKVHKQTLNNRQPYLVKQDNSELSEFYTIRGVIELAKLKGWQEPDLIPEGFE